MRRRSFGCSAHNYTQPRGGAPPSRKIPAPSMHRTGSPPSESNNKNSSPDLAADRSGGLPRRARGRRQRGILRQQGRGGGQAASRVMTTAAFLRRAAGGLAWWLAARGSVAIPQLFCSGGGAAVIAGDARLRWGAGATPPTAPRSIFLSLLPPPHGQGVVSGAAGARPSSLRAEATQRGAAPRGAVSSGGGSGRGSRRSKGAAASSTSTTQQQRQQQGRGAQRGAEWLFVAAAGRGDG